MPVISPCKSCAPVSCAGAGSVIDPASLYTLSGPAYNFVFNCPPGMDCNNVPYVFLQCCDEVVSVVLLGMSQAQRQRALTAALNRCANLWQYCNQIDGGNPGGGGSGGDTGQRPTVNLYYGQACCHETCSGAPQSFCLVAISPVSFAGAVTLAQQIACQQMNAGRVTIGNTLQCYTAACGGGDPFTATRCTEPNTYGQCLYFPTPAQIQIAQQIENDIALAFATADANQVIIDHGCLVCNTELSGFVSCPGDPTKTFNATIAAATYCSPPGTDPSVPFMKAQDALNTALHNGLAGTGCACPSPVSDRTTFRVTFTCATFLQWSFAAFGGIIAYGPGVYDAFAVASAYGGGPPTPGSIFRIHPIGWVGPDIVFTF